MSGGYTQALAVIGAGSWGTALAVQSARAGRPTLLWGRERADIDTMVRDRENTRYLPGITLPDELTPQASLESALSGVRDILVVVPSGGFRETLERIRPLLASDSRIAWATKGLEHGTGKLAHEVAREVLGADRPLAVMSGPTFASEVGKGLPSAMTIASDDTDFAEHLAESFHSAEMRTYTSDDIIGVQVGGASKNPLAIGAGISDGLGFGANTRTALITRGLAEMMRLAEALGGRALTLTGLAGVGDLILTCTDDQSRNRRCGLALAAGKTLDQARSEIGLIEGADAAREVLRRARSLGVEMPLISTVHDILFQGADPREATERLMLRELKAERD